MTFVTEKVTPREVRESNSRTGLPLSATFVKQVNRPGVYGDGRGGYGLTLRVRRMTNGRLSKVWVQRLRINGRATNLGLGSFPVVGLATARERALDNRRKIEQGIDPRIAENPTPTVADALEAVIEGRSASWKNGGRSAEIWRNSVRNHADNLIHRPVDQIDTGDVLRVIGPLWTDRYDTAKKVRQRLSLAFRWAMAAGHRPDDPAGEALLAALPRNGVPRRHMAALPPDRVPAALATIDNSAAYPTTKLAMRMLALTATRSGEVRGMCWDEIDNDIWTIPGERTKVSREFRVPLSPEALAVLDEARPYSDGSPDALVFPSARGRQITPDALSKLCHELDLGMTPHGLRSSFRDWCAESAVSRELAESCLAHVVKNTVEAAYRRSDLLEQRREVMNAWGPVHHVATGSTRLGPCPTRRQSNGSAGPMGAGRRPSRQAAILLYIEGWCGTVLCERAGASERARADLLLGRRAGPPAVRCCCRVAGTINRILVNGGGDDGLIP